MLSEVEAYLTGFQCTQEDKEETKTKYANEQLMNNKVHAIHLRIRHRISR